MAEAKADPNSISTHQSYNSDSACTMSEFHHLWNRNSTFSWDFCDRQIRTRKSLAQKLCIHWISSRNKYLLLLLSFYQVLSHIYNISSASLLNEWMNKWMNEMLNQEIASPVYLLSSARWWITITHDNFMEVQHVIK